MTSSAKLFPLCAPILFLATLNAQTVQVKLAETNAKVTLYFHLSKDYSANYDSVSIRTGDHRRFNFPTPNTIAPIPVGKDEQVGSGLPVRIAGFTLDPSHIFFRTQYTVDKSVHTLLLFVGAPRASDADPVLVLGFKSDGVPFVGLQRSHFEVTSLVQESEGARLIGKASLSQIMEGEGYAGDKKPYATTYDPFSVFLLASDQPATYSLSESEAYNRAHYVWAGPKTREDYAVLYNVPGHTQPFGAPSTRVATLLDPKKHR